MAMSTHIGCVFYFFREFSEKGVHASDSARE